MSSYDWEIFLRTNVPYFSFSNKKLKVYKGACTVWGRCYSLIIIYSFEFNVIILITNINIPLFHILKYKEFVIVWEFKYNAHYCSYILFFAETQKTSNTSKQTMVIAGSVVGVLVVVTLVIVLSCLTHRHFTLICNIGKYYERMKFSTKRS